MIRRFGGVKELLLQLMQVLVGREKGSRSRTKRNIIRVNVGTTVGVDDVVRAKKNRLGRNDASLASVAILTKAAAKAIRLNRALVPGEREERDPGFAEIRCCRSSGRSRPTAR